MRLRAIHFLAFLVVASLFAGCGFRLRGQTELPFVAAYVDAPAGSALGEGLRQSLRGLGKLADKSEGAPVRIKITGETREKNILSLSGSGKVSEYRLEYQVGLSVDSAAGTELIAPTQIHLTREFSYSDDQALAKETEEANLKRSMEQDALRQALRRLSYIKP